MWSNDGGVGVSVILKVTEKCNVEVFLGDNDAARFSFGGDKEWMDLGFDTLEALECFVGLAQWTVEEIQRREAAKSAGNLGQEP